MNQDYNDMVKTQIVLTHKALANLMEVLSPSSRLYDEIQAAKVALEVEIEG
jgi:hypothetical protein